MVALNEVTEMIGSKLHEIEESKEKYEREEREKAEQEKADMEKVEKDKAECEISAEAFGEDQVSSTNWNNYLQLNQYKQNFNSGKYPFWGPSYEAHYNVNLRCT